MADHIKNLKKLKGKKFWKYVIENKSDLYIVLDNDNTMIVEKNIEDGDHISSPNYLGNGDGIGDLLDALGIKWEHC